jgi:hypothetical protein
VISYAINELVFNEFVESEGVQACSIISINSNSTREHRRQEEVWTKALNSPTEAINWRAESLAAIRATEFWPTRCAGTARDAH